jgi:hypothetical protein
MIMNIYILVDQLMFVVFMSRALAVAELLPNALLLPPLA